jgi:hypothetical protein
MSTPADGEVRGNALRQSVGRQLRAWLQPQVSSGARDRRDITVLLVAVSLAVAPHFSHLPLWSTALVCVLWFWRAWLTIARRPPPGRIAMVPLLITASSLVWLQHSSLMGHDAGVNLLVLLMGMKLLELRTRRDLNIVVFLTFFVQVTVPVRPELADRAAVDLHDAAAVLHSSEHQPGRK